MCVHTYGAVPWRLRPHSADKMLPVGRQVARALRPLPTHVFPHAAPQRWSHSESPPVEVHREGESAQ